VEECFEDKFLEDLGELAEESTDKSVERIF